MNERAFAHSLGLGRLAYLLWHAPVGMVRRSIDAGGPLEQWRDRQAHTASSLSDLEAGIPLWMDIWRVPRRAVPDRLLNENVCDIFETGPVIGARAAINNSWPLVS
jgi:hypothetical protein